MKVITISNIRSASSNTKYVTRLKLVPFFLIKSINRPFKFNYLISNFQNYYKNFILTGVHTSNSTPA